MFWAIKEMIKLFDDLFLTEEQLGQALEAYKLESSYSNVDLYLIRNEH